MFYGKISLPSSKACAIIKMAGVEQSENNCVFAKVESMLEGIKRSSIANECIEKNPSGPQVAENLDLRDELMEFLRTNLQKYLCAIALTQADASLISNLTIYGLAQTQVNTKKKKKKKPEVAKEVEDVTDYESLTKSIDVDFAIHAQRLKASIEGKRSTVDVSTLFNVFWI